MSINAINGKKILDEELRQMLRPEIYNFITSVSSKRYHSKCGNYETMHFGLKVKRENPAPGIKMMCDAITWLYDNKLIYALSSSYDLSIFPLNKEFGKVNADVIYMAFLGSIKDREKIKEHLGVSSLTATQDALKEVEDLSVPLEEGEFLLEAKVAKAFYMTLVIHNVSPEETVNTEIERVVKCLPGSTEVRSVEDLGLSSMLSYGAEVKLYNPMLKGLSKIEPVFVYHEIEKNQTPTKLLIRIDYYDKSGKLIDLNGLSRNSLVPTYGYASVVKI